MTAIPIQFPIVDSKAMMGEKRRQLPTSNLFSNHQRSRIIQSNAILPIISLPSFSNFKQKLMQMATNDKSAIPTESRVSKMKSHTTNLNASFMPKSFLNYPTTVTRPMTSSHRSNNQQQQPNTRFLYIVNASTTPHRTVSARVPNNNQNAQQQQSALPSRRPHSQYEHFVAYLRRQSLARLRRKQEQEEGNIQTTVTLNLNKQTPQVFQSTSNFSLGSLAIDTSSMPLISITGKRGGRPLSSYRQVQRSATSYRLNLIRQPPPTPTSKNSTDDQSSPLTSSTVLITPRNSVVDDTAPISMMKLPYELHLNNDMLNYCYVSDSGVAYQGQMLSSAV